MLGFGSVHQALCISFSVFFCEFLFAPPSLCEKRGVHKAYRGFGEASREEFLIHGSKMGGGAIVAKVQRGSNQMVVGMLGNLTAAA